VPVGKLASLMRIAPSARTTWRHALAAGRAARRSQSARSFAPAPAATAACRQKKKKKKKKRTVLFLFEG